VPEGSLGQLVVVPHFRGRPEVDYEYAGTTRPNVLYFTDECIDLWGDHEFVLHEFHHLINQWANGRMTRLGYIINPAPWEAEANNFASTHLFFYLDCLSNYCGNKPPSTSGECEG
jgi:hypothetical protein